MVWSIVLAVLSALPQALTTWLGFHITASPQVLADQTRIRRYRILFIAMLVLSIVVTGITAYRGTKVEYVVVERAHFAITQTWPTSSPVWPLVGERLGANFRFKNVGNGMAHNTVFLGIAVLERDYSPYSEKEAIEEFEKRIKALPVGEGASSGKDKEAYTEENAK